MSLSTENSGIAAIDVALLYKELQYMNGSLTDIQGKLQDLDVRVRSLEITNAKSDTTSGWWRTAWEMLYSLFLAIIAAGVWLK